MEAALVGPTLVQPAQLTADSLGQGRPQPAARSLVSVAVVRVQADTASLHLSQCSWPELDNSSRAPFARTVGLGPALLNMVVLLAWECRIGMEGTAAGEEFHGFPAVPSGLLDLARERFVSALPNHEVLWTILDYPHSSLRLATPSGILTAQD